MNNKFYLYVKFFVYLSIFPMIFVFSACSKSTGSMQDTDKTQKQQTSEGTPMAKQSPSVDNSDDSEPSRKISGKCGANAKWFYDEEKQCLTISGTGVVDEVIDKGEQEDDIEYLDQDKHPIKEIKVEEGITALDGGPIFFNLGKEEDTKEIKISLPNSLEKIGTDTFDPDYKISPYIRHIHLPKNVRVIEAGALWGLGDSQYTSSGSYQEDVKAITENYNTSFEITIDKNNPYYIVEDNVLFTKDKKTLVYYPVEKTEQVYRIPKSIVKIEALAFAGNAFIGEVVLPRGLTELGAGAFCRDYRLTTINLHQANKVKELHDFDGIKHKFYCCGSGTPEWKRYNDLAFSDGDESRYSGSKKFAMKWYDHNTGYPRHWYMFGTFGGTDLREIEFPDSLKYAGYSTFSGCVNLEKITLGKSFAGDINPTEYCDEKGFALPLEQSTDKIDIQVPANSKHYKVRNHVVYSADGKTVYGITKEYRGKTLVLDKNVRIITRNAFHQSKLKKVVVLGSLEHIGSVAFLGSDIKEFEVRGDIHTIDIEAFYNCAQLKKFTCQGTIAYICDVAFYDDSNLKKFSCKEIKSVEEDAFEECDSIIFE